MKRISTQICLSVMLGGLFLLPADGWAQTSAGVNDARTFGTTITSHTLSAWAFTGYDAANSTRFAADSVAGRYCAGAPCFFVAPLNLPSGAVLVDLELVGCDFPSGGSRMTMTVLRTVGGGAPLVSMASVPSGGGVFACDTWPGNFSPPQPVIDNASNFYFIQVGSVGTNSNTTFSGVRIHYRLQVSPAPAVATFNDVPTTHPFFAVIEALVAAGITTGCDDSPPLFCPDGVVTRKQMAAFIARALGLHWAP